MPSRRIERRLAALEDMAKTKTAVCCCGGFGIVLRASPTGETTHGTIECPVHGVVPVIYLSASDAKG
jgi:hypothetical protein